MLRPMTDADIDAVLDLERDVFGAEAWSRQMLAGELAQQPASRYYLVAEEDGQVAVYAGLLGAGWQGDVVTLAEAARRGCTEVFLEVRTDNKRAQELYRRHDFTEIGIRRGYYQPSGADALVMRRTLARGSSPIHEATGEQA
jgi:ribosomal-protein-alanine N-acetyltransferase